jgi:hypothetical protein
VPNEKVILGMAIAAGTSTTYVLSGKFSPDEQFKLYNHNDTEIEKHPIMQNEIMLAQFIEGQEKVQFNKEKNPITLMQFINNNFSDEINNNLYPSIKFANQLCDLERCINDECERLEQIDKSGTHWVAVSSKSTVTIPEALDRLRKKIEFIKQLRGIIVEFPEYTKDKEISVAIEKNKLLKQKINGNTLPSIVPIFIQPFMLLFQIFLAKLGLL